jgi:hypothetical protein
MLRSLGSPQQRYQPSLGRLPMLIERFFSQGTDVRFDEGVGEKVLSVIQSHGAQSVVNFLSPVPLLGRAGSFYAETHSLTNVSLPCLG